MPALTKTQKIESLAKLLQKRYKGMPEPPERAVVEHLVYAALLENAPFELADAAMNVLENYFIDWNEVRVSTVGELADVFSMLPDPRAAGERARKALQGIFEKKYSFDLEDLRKKGTNLSHAVGFFESTGACSRFMIDYTAQVALGGHVIPLDAAALQLFRLLGLAQVNKEGTREDVPGLERAIAKKNGVQFSVRLHQVAATHFDLSTLEELRTMLKPLDPEAVKRDCMPPVLIVMKPAPQEQKPKVAPAVAQPFVATDEDDFEEESAGIEAAFIPEGGDPDELPVHRAGERLPTVSPTSPLTETKGKKSEKGKAVKSGSEGESVAQKIPPQKKMKAEEKAKDSGTGRTEPSVKTPSEKSPPATGKSSTKQLRKAKPK